MTAISQLATWAIGPVGRFFVAGAGVLVVVGGIYGKGRLDQRASDRATEQAERVRQAAAITKISQDAAVRDAQSDTEKAALQQKVDAYVTELQSQTGACLLSDADASRLRDIR